MRLRTRCDLCFDVDLPTPIILMLRPRSGWNQWIERESFVIEPGVQLFEYIDAYGNLCQRLIAPAGTLSIHTDADIRTSEQIDIAPGAPFDEIGSLPDSVLTYLLPSRYCESDRFIELARDIAAGMAPGYDQVDAVNRWLREHIRFNQDTAQLQLSAIEVNLAGQGVCRDLAHLGIALCRALCIPARMVVGYLYGLHPMDFHAWFEAYVGGRWYAFDPTQPTPRGGRVIVAYGHDAADVAIFTQFGLPLPPARLSVSVERLPNIQE